MNENKNEIKNADLIDESVNARVEMAINKAMFIYLTRLKMGMIDEGLEASFQMHLAGLLRDELEVLTIDKNERFVVELEKNMEKENNGKNYVDICVEYHKNGCLNELYPIELKFKKKSQSAEDLGVMESFKDIYNLEQLTNIKACYFIFLTDHELYTKQPKNSGTRKVFSMYHGAKIKQNQNYKYDSKTAKNMLEKYPNGFDFKYNYKIDYQKITIPSENNENKNLWFFKLKIPPK